jgi:hypothetical protein
MYISTTTSITFVWIMLLRYTTSGQKIDVTIPIMMTASYKHKNTMNRAINTVQNSIYVRRMGILTKYKPKLKPVIFYRDSPDEILQIRKSIIQTYVIDVVVDIYMFCGIKIYLFHPEIFIYLNSFNSNHLKNKRIRK